MHDLPSQTLLQQRHAKPKTGEELEVLGKQAAAMYLNGECPNLTEAVVETVKHAGLSPEQVRRVVEFTNTSAYLKEFEKKASHKYIDFHGGPANPAEILKDLNDGGGGTVFDRGDGDYHSPPAKTASLVNRNLARLMQPDLEKTAATRLNKEVLKEFAKTKDWGGAAEMLVKGRGGQWAPGGAKALGAGVEISHPHGAMGEVGKVVQKLVREGKTSTASVDFNPAETAFDQLFKVAEKPEPYAHPWADAEDLREKLGAAREHLTAELSRTETELLGLTEDLYGHVKQAALEGTPLGYVVQAWSEVTPGAGFIKAAFSSIGPRLAAEGVFESLGDVGDSLVKMAGEVMADHRHPLMQCFAAFCTSLEKLAGMRAARTEIGQHYDEIDRFIKQGAMGIVPKCGAGLSS